MKTNIKSKSPLMTLLSNCSYGIAFLVFVVLIGIAVTKSAQEHSREPINPPALSSTHTHLTSSPQSFVLTTSGSSAPTTLVIKNDSSSMSTIYDLMLILSVLLLILTF